MSARVDALTVAAVAAVTPVGLTAPQTCAALRAGISGIRQAILRPPPEEPLLVARVPARAVLRGSDRQWLVNLASRSIREVLSQTHIPAERIALFLSLPEPRRGHPAFFGASAEDLFHDIEARLRLNFSHRSRVLVGGHAAALQALTMAHVVLRDGDDACLLSGVDSLLNPGDIDTLSRAGRLHETNSPQGVIPGEGAAAVLLTRPERASKALSVIAGWADTFEADSVLGDNYSVGNGLSQAIAGAAIAAGIDEPQIVFRVSDMNGERYRGWESFLAATRYYRTHRESLPFRLPAMGVGDLGAAASVLGLVVASMSMSRGYAPGPVACCEASSEDGGRAAAIVMPAHGAPIPPFRSRHVPS